MGESRAISDYRHILVTQVGDVTVVRFRDQKIIEDISIQEWGQELLSLVDVDNRQKILLNFTGVAFLSSAALGKLITLNTRVRSLNGSLKLCGIRPEIYEVFQITKLNRVFEIYTDESEALSAF